MTPSDHESAVRARYSAGAEACQESLCCSVSYDARYLEVLPDELIEKDYGCGDPTPYVRPGNTVLDLGCGAGKVCWIAAQIAGPQGRVIGLDMNEDMLALAEKHHAEVARRIGYDTVEFRRARIQDLRLDLDRLDAGLPPADPLVPDASIDVVLSNCVLNLVPPQDKQALFEEIHRVVRPGGQAAISDIVADRDVPAELQADPELWSGCISGALREDRFVQAFADVGFGDVQVVARDEQPWRTVEGIEFRSITVRALKGEAPRRQEIPREGGSCCGPEPTGCC